MAVATKTDVSISAVGNVMYGNDGLTENNSIIELMNIASCRSMIGETSKAKSLLEKLIQNVDA